MVEPTALVDPLPVGSAVAPPGEERARRGNEVPQRIDPSEGGGEAFHGLHFDLRVGYDAFQTLMRPDIRRKRRDVEVADQHQAARVPHLPAEPASELAVEAKLVRELRIALRVGKRSPGGSVDVVKLDAALQSHLKVAAVLPAAPVADEHFLERKTRENGDAVLALLARERVVREAELPETLEGEVEVRNLRLLEAENVRGVRVHQAPESPHPEAHGIDVPAQDLHETEGV